MKRPLLSLLIGSAVFVAPQVASATLLVGYSDFAFTSNIDNTPNESLSGFSGVLTKSSTLIDVSTTGGSSDGFYGPDSTLGGGVAIGGGVPNPTNNGRIGGVAGVTLTVTNGTLAAYALESLLFDGRRNGEANPTTYTVSWSSPGGSGSQGGMAAVNGGGAPVTLPYDDFKVNLGSIILGAGQSIVFTWSATDVTSRIDNIALTGLTAIPETASLLALGCLVASGALLRTRRRAPMLRMA
ncbi:MAG: hypothetical protein NTV46_22015 [Verrucomicrobia bacterium]|nr:hypothetical protein [Verrucomicrobiota bacterium]